ncbi:MAG: Ig-like domain-containing protein, partial [Bacteroidetes bacterium]|nr:Ig-like domain-containing protein [Bacteroidota bacterium]
MFREFGKITSRSKKVLFCSFLISLLFFLFSPVADAAFVDNGDGTVTDTTTGLMWQKADDGIPRNWLEALEYAEGLELAGCNTWRLPNIKELRSIVDRSQTDPAIDTSIFSAQSDKYWSSTLFRYFKKEFVVDFLSGRMRFADPLGEVHFIRAVTGGCNLDRTAPTVVSTSPANGATGVAVNTLITAEFSEGMDPATITGATFLTNAGATPVAGTVSYSNGTATFTPSANLPSDTTYYATIKPGVKDVAGNSLAADYWWSFTTIDATPPSGSIIIDGNASYTKSTTVTLSLPATDNSGVVDSMQLSNDGVSWSAWEAYSPVKSWDLTSGDAEKTVYVKFRDATGNQSVAYSDTIILDTSGPFVTVDAVISPTNKTSQTISGTTEAGATVEVRVDTWANVCVVEVDNTTWECAISGLAEGVNTVTVKAIDEAGNFNSAGTNITVDTVAPTGSVVIENNAAWTNSRAVALNLSASDNSGVVSSMRFANVGDTWSAWEAFALNKLWSLDPGDGIKTVSVQFMDGSGNQSDIFSDTIELDTVSPSFTVDATAVIHTNVPSRTVTVTGTREADAIVNVVVDTAAMPGVSYPTAISWECAINSLVAGYNNVAITAIDGVGNESAESKVS